MNAEETRKIRLAGYRRYGKNNINIIVFHAGENVLLEENRLHAKLTDFGSAGSCQVS